MIIKSNYPYVKTSAGFVGTSDGVMDWSFDTAEYSGGGNIALTAQFHAAAALGSGWQRTLKHHNGQGWQIDREDYLAGLEPLEEMAAFSIPSYSLWVMMRLLLWFLII